LHSYAVAAAVATAQVASGTAFGFDIFNMVGWCALKAVLKAPGFSA